ncbi:uncharacterized protein LOC128234285 isoform X2 [Mya arenaria]|nr:uncharacterized protein LOC128234285 isoform X2 [Mya arenaria]
MEFKNIIILISTILMALLLQISTSEHFAEDCTESQVLCKKGMYAENACYSFKQAACLLKDILNFTNIFTTTTNLEKHVDDRIAGFNETMFRQISVELESVNERLNKSIQEKVEVISNNFNKAEGDIKKLYDTLDEQSNSTDHVKQEVSKMNSSIRGDINISISELRTNLENQTREIKTTLEQLDEQTKASLNSNIKQLNGHFDDLSNSTDHIRQEVSKMNSSIRGDIEISLLELRTNLENQKQDMSTELKKRDAETKTYLERNSETLKSDLKDLNLTFVETNSSLSKRIADMEDQLWINEEDEGGETQRISVKEEVVNTQKHFDANNTRLQHNIDDLQKECQSQFKTLIDQVKIVKDSYTQHVSETTNQLKSLQEKTTSIEENLATFRKENKDDILLVQEEIKKEKDNVSEMKERVEKNIKATEDSLKIFVETTRTSLQNEFDEKLDKFKANISETLDSVRVEIEKIKVKLENQLANVTSNVSYHKAIIDVILPNTFNKDFFMLAFMLLCLMVIVNFVVLLCCVTKSRSTSAMTGQWATGTGEMTGNHRASRSPFQVMDKLDFSRSLRQRRGLEAEISLVYFNGDVAPVITKVMLQISEHLPDHLRQQQIPQYRIRHHDDIPGIPHSKLCFMFAEFHERHVIIEEPGLGLGDLKRSTVTAIEKLGANLVILYVLHPDSRRLRENELFHDAIYCTRKQSEVKKFADDERFLSLYDKCTDFQTQNLVKIIKETLF